MCRERIHAKWPALLVIGVVGLLVLPHAVSAQTYRGVAISTDYPAIVTAPRDVIVFNLAVSNYEVAPQRVDLAMVSSQPGWEHAFVGGGGLIEAVFASPQKQSDAQLWLSPPANVAPGQYRFVVRAAGQFGRFDLPLTVTIGERLPQRLELRPELPALRGSATADFTFRAALNNRSTQEALVNFNADAPAGFRVTFRKRFQNQDVTAIPIEPGAEETIEIRVRPPQDIAAGDYPVRVVAQAEGIDARADLTVTIEGQPELAITGPGGRLSDTAVAGRARPVRLTVENRGAADAQNITFRGTPPRNWEVSFEPAEVSVLPPGESVEVVATITPSSEAITGDYNVTLRASGEGVQASERFRITVRTSAVWGVVAVVVIALALLVVVFAMRRYGRR